jgi:thiol-disulfide isomerase/thioredoxin
MSLLFGYAQDKAKLIVGKNFPYAGSFYFNDNYKTGISFNQTMRVPVIIDLFSSTCVVCFQMLPKINLLQKKFNDSVRFMLIGYEDGKIKQLFQKFKERLGLRLDVAYDSVVFHHVEINYVPTYIWVNIDGTIAAVTGPDDVKEKNVQSFINRENLSFGQNILRIAFDQSVPFGLNGNGAPDTGYLMRSVLADWTPGLPVSMPIKLEYRENTRHFNTVGLQMKQLYNYAYWGKAFWDFGDSLYGKVSLQPVIQENNNDSNRRFCYTTAYNGMKPDLKRTVQNDLAGYFGYQVQIEKRKLPCYVVRQLYPKARKLESKEVAFKGALNHGGFEYSRIIFSEIMNILAYYNESDIPFIDESGIDYPIDIKVDALLTEQDDFFSALHKAGITISKEEREMSVLVLYKK